MKPFIHVSISSLLVKTKVSSTKRGLLISNKKILERD